MYTKVAGVTFSNSDGAWRQNLIREFGKSGKRLIFKREPRNPADPNAVAVWLPVRSLFFPKAFQIGYLNHHLAPEVARFMDTGGSLEGIIAEVTGGTREKPTLGVNMILTKVPTRH